MWTIWIKQNATTWIESRRRYVEESEAREAAATVKRMFYIEQVFIQFSNEEAIEITDF